MPKKYEIPINYQQMWGLLKEVLQKGIEEEQHRFESESYGAHMKSQAYGSMCAHEKILNVMESFEQRELKQGDPSIVTRQIPKITEG